MTGAVFLNGRVVAAARARVSAFDRGLLYGDGLFETLRAYRGTVFALDAHVARLHETAHWLGIAVPTIDWPRHIAAVLRRNGLTRRDASVRITVTRGAGRPGLLPPRSVTPTVLISAGPIDPAIRRAQRRGVRAVLLPFARDGEVARHKLLHFVPAILGRVIARRERAFEALYVSQSGRLSEGTTSNLFICRRGRLLTPPLDGALAVLPGVTRRLVIELATAAKLRVGERPIRLPDLLQAEEAFCTSSLIEIVPLVRVGDHVVGSGRPGPLTRRLQHMYRDIVSASSAS